MDLLNITDWTHEDVLVTFARVDRANANNIIAVSHSIVCISRDSERDALRMEIWRADRSKSKDWGDFCSTPRESAEVDLRVLRTQQERERG